MLDEFSLLQRSSHKFVQFSFMPKLALPPLSPCDTRAQSKQFRVNSHSVIAACMNWNKIPLLDYIGSYDHEKKPLSMKPGEATTFHVNILKFDNSMFWFGFERPIGGDSLFGVYFSPTAPSVEAMWYSSVRYV